MTQQKLSPFGKITKNAYKLSVFNLIKFNVLAITSNDVILEYN